MKRPLLVLFALVLGACAPGETTTDDPSGALRLGHFPNLTHATAIVGVQKGLIQDALGDTKLDVKTFNAGGDAVTALISGAIDATYIGPNPAINAFAQSEGKDVRIIAGATSGGAFLVTKPDITSPEDLAPDGEDRKVIATPQLGNTQDVALRAWLKEQGYETTAQGGGDVEVKPQENAQSLETLKSGAIDGAWVPEPWATRLVQEGDGKVLVDERDLWPNSRYVTTHLIVRTDYLEEKPDQVEALLEGHIAANDFIKAKPDEAKKVVNAGIEKITSKPIAADVLDAAWKNLEFTVDPVAPSLEKSADAATALDLLDPVDLKGIYDLTLLNELLRAESRKEVEGL
jgi:NitT/TauT family transport system substrate-binding protein